MADQFDRASDLEEAQRESALQAHFRMTADRRLNPMGKCHNCDEQVPAGGLFCDADCSSDHEARTRARRY